MNRTCRISGRRCQSNISPANKDRQVYLRRRRSTGTQSHVAPRRTRDTIDRESTHGDAVHGTKLHYDKLLIATGSRARLPQHSRQRSGGHPLPAHNRRRRRDSRRIRPGKASPSPAAVTSDSKSPRSQSKPASNVTVLEMEDRILKRVTTPAMSAFYHALHTGRSVNIRTSAKVSGFAGKTATSKRS